MHTASRTLICGFALLLSLSQAAGQTAVTFKTPGSYLEVAPSETVLPPEFTLEFWIMVRDLGDPEQAGGEQTVFDNRQDTTGINIRLAGTQFPISVFGFTVPYGGVGAFGVIHRHIWHHVALTVDADSVRIYVDGQFAAADSVHFDNSPTTPMRIGEFTGFPWASLGLRGDLDEVRIWDHARTEEELHASMHERMDGTETGLMAYWDFESAADGWTPDGTPNGNNALAIGQVGFIPSYAPVGFVPPPVPVGLRAHGDETYVTLHWKSLGAAASGYELHRGTENEFDAAGETLLAVLPEDQSSYVDHRVASGFRYYYRLRSLDGDGHAGQPGRTAAGGTTTNGGYRVGVDYYPYWGPEEGGRAWEGQYLRGRLVPEQPPLLGHYSSRAPAVIQQHLAWMDEYEIDFLSSSWWGRDSWEDSTLRFNLIPEIEKTWISFAILYESSYLGFDAIREIRIEGDKAQRVIDDFEYLGEAYFGHPNYLRVDGRPVVFLGQASAMTGDHDQTFAHVRSLLEARGHDVLIVGGEIGWGAASDRHLAFLDAVTASRFRTQPYDGYLLDLDFLADVSAKLAEWEAFGHPRGKSVVPIVEPGFNGRAPDAGGLVVPRPIAPRASTAGGELTSTLEEYIRISRPFVDEHLRLIKISTWNGWGNDTQIEPTIVAAPTSSDISQSGFDYTGGYMYEGYSFQALELIRDLLADPSTVDAAPVEQGVPARVDLTDNYPDPFNPVTTFSFALPRSMRVRVVVFDALGRMVRIVTDGVQLAGSHATAFHAGGLPSGVYFYRLETDAGSLTRSMILSK